MAHESESYELRAVAPHFDARYYLQANPDVAAARVDPLMHFCKQGWREGRNPSVTFSVAHYLSAYPDIATTGMNPVLHYAVAGLAEGRLPRRPLDAERSLLEAAHPPTPYGRDWEGGSDAPDLDRTTLASRLAAVAGSPALVVSVSHDDYHTHLGGVQNVLRDERLTFEELGCSYL